MATHQGIDALDDRTAGCLATWLKRTTSERCHPPRPDRRLRRRLRYRSRRSATGALAALHVAVTASAPARPGSAWIPGASAGALTRPEQLISDRCAILLAPFA
ncbi:hypothetical protein Ate01nite_01630 [Actinoplanes teichomyceticus]|nr:hypothetical protein Ate01nite_01630 [Actinoplanes teichomyceticus]